MKNIIKTKIKHSFKINQKHIEFLNVLQLSNEKLNDKIEKEISENNFLELTEIPKMPNSNNTIISKKYNEEIINNTMLYTETLYSYLMNKMECLFLNEKDKIIAEYIISSLNEKGYFTTSNEIVINDIKVMYNINCDSSEIDSVLHKLQTLDPAGVCARSLQECLLLQLSRKKNDKDNVIAIDIIRNHWEDFSKQHFNKIKKNIMLSDIGLERIKTKIKNLNPIPSNIFKSNNITPLKPDFRVEEKNGELYVTLTNNYIHNIKLKQLSKLAMLKNKNDKYSNYMRCNYENAKNFLQMLEKREHSLQNIMEIIVQIQHDYFISWNIQDLKPMKLKDIAEKANLDISIISRIVNSKVVETQFGIFLLKHFFSKGIKNKNGTIISNKVIKYEIKNIISNNKNHVNDKTIALMLNNKGINIARRTVTKYRQQLLLPSTRTK